jgi:hypothetical protein
MSTLAVNTITNAAGGNTAQINGMTPTADSLQGFRNRIINGDMRIDQRNAGASVTPASGNYPIDRWGYFATQASKFTTQRNAGAVTPPLGFPNYFGMTVAATATIGASDFFILRQNIEGFNSADFGWGAAGAQAVTISFIVRSSLTGTFGAAVQNGADNRAYPFTYTISDANTWETKTITIPGDTSGTWATDNTTGIRLTFGLGVGSTFSGTVGAWVGSNLLSATGATNVVGTSGATFYITGVQLEAGSVATPFERRDYGRELIMCQRYYQAFTAYGVNTASFPAAPIFMRTSMRATPTGTTGAGSLTISSADLAFINNGANAVTNVTFNAEL